MSPIIAHALAQIDAALAAFNAHPLKATSKRDRAFIAGNALESYQVAEDGGAFDLDAARAFCAYISARTLKAHRVEWISYVPAPVPQRSPVVAAMVERKARQPNPRTMPLFLLMMRQGGLTFTRRQHAADAEGARSLAELACPGASVTSVHACGVQQPAPRMVPQQAQQQQGRDMRKATPGHRFGGAHMRYVSSCECGWQSATHCGKGSRGAAYDEWRQHIDMVHRAGAAPAMVPQQAQQQQANAGTMSARDRAATVLSIETMRAKADRAGPVDAARLRAAAARLEADLAEAPVMVPQQAQQQQANAGELPPGYRIEQDDDGDWLLVPPATVTIFSAPGEPILIGKCSREAALSDARDMLRDIAHGPVMVPQQAQQQQGRDMRAGPDADVRRATAEAFRSTDGAWQNALVQQFGRRAADVRYTAAGAGEPGSDLRRLYSDRYRAYKAWAEARGMDAAPDALCEPLPAVHPHYLPALAYETGHVVDDGELTYATPADREACVARALAAGWRLDVLSARLDDWPWYRLAEEGDTSAVQRDGEWRFYVETAAEALAYVGEADHVALVEMAR